MEQRVTQKSCSLNCRDRDMLERAGLAHGGLSLSSKPKAVQEAFYRKITHSSEMLLFFKKEHIEEKISEDTGGRLRS